MIAYAKRCLLGTAAALGTIVFLFLAALFAIACVVLEDFFRMAPEGEP